MSFARLVALCAVFLFVPAASAVAAAGWAPTGSLQFERSDHGAVRLGDGRVLVAGGTGASDYMSSAELYDPATGRWSPTGSLHGARTAPTMVGLADGRVLILGGMATYDLPLNSAEIYDPRTGLWTQTGEMGHARLSPAALLLPDGRVLVAGGLDANRQQLRTAELFEPATGLWSDAGQFADVASGSAAALLPSGRVLVTGGYNGDDAITTTRRYDGGTAWAAKRAMTQARHGHLLTALPDGRLLATGGTGSSVSAGTVEIYDPLRDEWMPGASTRAFFTADATVALGRGFVLMTGAERLNGAPVPSTQLYDPKRDAWTATATQPARRRWASATQLADGRVLVVGGIDPALARRVTSAEIWTPTTTLATESSIPFGDTTLRASTSGVVQITNTGDFPLFLGDFTIQGAHPGDFTAGDGCRAPVAPGGTCTLDVRFSPSEAGVRGGRLMFSANTATAQIVSLGGRGVPAAVAAPPGSSPTPGAGGLAPDGDRDGVTDSVDRCPDSQGGAGRAGCPAGLLADPSITYKRVRGGIKVVAYHVKATTGATVVVKCSRGCKPTTVKGQGARRIRISRLNNRRLANGTKITITVSLPGRLTTTVTDSVSRARRVEGRPVCTPVGC